MNRQNAEEREFRENSELGDFFFWRPWVPVGTALSGRPPDRSRRADFPHRAPTLGLRASVRQRRPGMMESRQRKREVLLELRELLPSPRCALAPPLKLAVPGRAHAFPELMQRSEVRGHPVVAVVPLQHACEPGALHSHRLMPTFAHLLT